MTCNLAETLLQSSLDGRLAQTERVLLDAHLEHCAACRREWETQRHLAQLADRWGSRSLALSDPGESFTAQVLDQIESQPMLSSLRFWLPLMATLLLIALILLLPGLPHLGFGLPGQWLNGLPGWLGAIFSHLPGDALTVFRLPQAALLPSWVGLLLPAALVVNGLFWLSARQSFRQRSVS